MKFKMQNLKEKLENGAKEVMKFTEKTTKETKETVEKLQRDVKKIRKANKIKEILKNLNTTDNLSLQYAAYLDIAELMKQTKEEAQAVLNELRKDIENITDETVLEKYQTEMTQYKNTKGGTIGLRQLRNNLIRLEEIKTEQTKKDFKKFDKKTKQIENEILKTSKTMKNKLKIAEKDLEVLNDFEKSIGQLGLIDALVAIEESYEIIPSQPKKSREELLKDMKEIVEKVSASILKFIWDETIQDRSSKLSTMMNAEEQKLYKNISLFKQNAEKIILKTKDDMFLIVKNETKGEIDLLLLIEKESGEKIAEKLDEKTETIKIEKFVENFA